MFPHIKESLHSSNLLVSYPAKLKYILSNCRVTAVDGHYQIGIYTLREIQYGEEITFDYNSVTEVCHFAMLF